MKSEIVSEQLKISHPATNNRFSNKNSIPHKVVRTFLSTAAMIFLILSLTGTIIPLVLPVLLVVPTT